MTYDAAMIENTPNSLKEGGPDTIRDAKFRLLRSFISMAADQNQMERGEVIERIEQVLANGFITADDAAQLTNELDGVLPTI